MNIKTNAKPTCSEADFNDANESSMGWCRDCDAFTTDSCEPDARNYDCDSCGAASVFGAEEALMMGILTLS